MFLLGHWDNYEALEEALSLEELMSTLSAMREKEHRRNKFMAALKGIDLDEADRKAQMERVVEEMRKIEEAQGIKHGPRTEADELAAFGLAVVNGDEL